MAERSSAKSQGWFLTLPALLIIAVFFVVPLIWIVILSFMTQNSNGGVEAQATLGNYVRFLSDQYYLQDLLWRTVRLSAVATVVAVFIGYVGALVIVRASLRLQPWLIFLCMCPLWVNLVVRTLSLMVLLDRRGPVNQILVAVGLADRPVQLLFNELSVVIGMVQVSVPFVVLALYAVLQAIPRDLERAAMSVGANPFEAFRRVTLPLSVPGVLAGSILAFGINMESFVVPILLGGGRVRFMSVAAYEAVTISNNLPFAATIGVILLVVTVLMLAIFQKLVSPANRTAIAMRAA
jgi:ABC-type spermidine/putrescine transport system permease subunit I